MFGAVVMATSSRHHRQEDIAFCTASARTEVCRASTARCNRPALGFHAAGILEPVAARYSQRRSANPPLHEVPAAAVQATRGGRSGNHLKRDNAVNGCAEYGTGHCDVVGRNWSLVVEAYARAISWNTSMPQPPGWLATLPFVAGPRDLGCWGTISFGGSGLRPRSLRSGVADRELCGGCRGRSAALSCP